MKLEEYIQEASRTCPELSLYASEATRASHTDNVHMVLGMVTEAAELADVFKKNMAYGKTIDWVNVHEEIFDLLWYVVNFCRLNNIDMEKGMATNIEKLRTRFPHQFTGEAAINRNVAAERVVLEQ